MRRGRKLDAICFIGILSVILSLSGTLKPLLAQEANPPGVIFEELKLFSKAMGVILEAYVEDRQPRNLLYDAVKGMMGSLDPYSGFISKEQYSLLKITMKGEYSGIGARLEAFEGLPVIKEIQKGSAAEKNGLLIDDRIMKVDGKLTSGKPLPEVSALLRGEENTALLLNIFRPLTRKTFDVKIVREKVIIPVVKDARMIGKRLGYLRVSEFSDNTPKQVMDNIKDLRQQGLQALIIDMRYNQGGVMNAAVDLADHFLPAGAKVVSVKSKIAEQRKEYTSSGKDMEPDYPILILINEISASAAEIFTAAMQENKRAKVLGVKSYGKASVQAVIPLDDVTAMKMTTARYVTPLGHVIDHVGITPDEIVANGQPGAPGADQQTERALLFFKDYM